MSDLMKNFLAKMQQSVFCYARTEGQGFVDQSDCECFKQKDKQCDAYLESEMFHSRYFELEKDGLSRSEIISTITKEFDGKESYWFKQNVVI